MPKVLKALYVLFIFLVIIVPLLASSDAIFSMVLSDFFGNLFNGINIINILTSLFSTVALSWFILLIFWSLELVRYIPNHIELPRIKIDKIYNYIILGGINTIYCLFLFIQFRYTWFVDSTNFIHLGISYSEYIHSGFYQLITIAIINYCIYLYFYKKTHEKGEMGIKVNLYVLILSTIMITISALSRIILYIEVYHMTVLRFFVVYIIICILILFIFSIFSLYRENRRYIGIFISLILVSFVGIGYFNVDSFVAEYNIKHAQLGYSDLDIDYITSLSNDAINEKIQIFSVNGNIPMSIGKDVPTLLLGDQQLQDYYIAPFFHYNFFQEKLLSYIRSTKLRTFPQ